MTEDPGRIFRHAFFVERRRHERTLRAYDHFAPRELTGMKKCT